MGRHFFPLARKKKLALAFVAVSVPFGEKPGIQSSRKRGNSIVLLPFHGTTAANSHYIAYLTRPFSRPYGATEKKGEFYHSTVAPWYNGAIPQIDPRKENHTWSCTRCCWPMTRRRSAWASAARSIGKAWAFSWRARRKTAPRPWNWPSSCAPMWCSPTSKCPSWTAWSSASGSSCCCRRLRWWCFPALTISNTPAGPSA